MRPTLSMQPTRPSKQEVARFLHHLRLLVLDEAEIVEQRTHQLWAKQIGERVALGRAIEGLAIGEIQRNGHITLSCQQNSSRFREGDILMLNRGDPFEEPRARVTLERDDENELVLSTGDLAANWGVLDRERDGWVLDEGYIDMSGYVLDALAEAGDTAVGRGQILPLLMGHGRAGMDVARYERGLDLAHLFGLNWSQGEALAQAYATSLAYLIQGPPGTGKTRVLAHLAQALAEEGARVLVTSHTHRAINNALNMLARVAPFLPVIKIGSHTRADGLLVENYEDFDSSPMAEMAGGYVIGATPYATRTSRLRGVEFETVIFDEASQITLPLAIMGMLAGKRHIFIGDHQQLPPVLAGRHSGPFEESVFGFLVDQGFDTMLTETYRLNAELVAWPSQHFYDGKLKPANEGVATHRVAYTRPPTRMAAVLHPDRPMVFVDLLHRNATTRSRQEASAVVDIVLSLLDAGFPPAEIGIVAPYRAQGREIRSLLHQAIRDAETCHQIVTDTVERMQGQERDLIIVSLTTSNPAFAADLAEFFFQPQRINVAVTRARKKLIIVGSSHVLRAEPAEPDLQAAVDLLRHLVQMCHYLPMEHSS